MASKKPKYPEVAYLNAQENYKQTGDERYIVLAIGAFFENPPLWAIQECRNYFVKCREQNFSNFWKSPGPKLTDKDYEKLGQMSDLIAAGMSVHAAATKVTTEDGEKEANIKKLTRQYNKEKYINEQGELEAPRRLERAIAQRVKSGKWGKK